MNTYFMPYFRGRRRATDVSVRLQFEPTIASIRKLRCVKVSPRRRHSGEQKFRWRLAVMARRASQIQYDD